MEKTIVQIKVDKNCKRKLYEFNGYGMVVPMYKGTEFIYRINRSEDGYDIIEGELRKLEAEETMDNLRKRIKTEYRNVKVKYYNWLDVYVIVYGKNMRDGSKITASIRSLSDRDIDVRRAKLKLRDLLTGQGIDINKLNDARATYDREEALDVEYSYLK